MARARRSDLYVGIDIGTETVRAVIAERNESGLDILGVGKAMSTGLKRGVVINIESTVSAIRAAVEAAELMAGREVTEAYVSISGSHIRGFNSTGVVAVRNSEVRPDDVARVLRAAQAVRIPPGRDIVHVLPIEFTVDENDGVKGPVGMAGVRLEAKVHIATAARPAIDNAATCCNREGIKVSGMVFSAIAASQTALHEDEKELGVVLADIGAGTTDIAVWFNNSVIQTGVINIGGSLISNDIAVGLRTPKGEAEQIKLKYGCAISSAVGDDETVEVPSVGGRQAQIKSRRFLAEIIEPRVEEIFTMIGEEVRRGGFEEHVSSGLVLVGGASRMPGMAELGQQILGIPVRIGDMVNADHSIGGVASAVADSGFGVALGMVLMAARQEPVPVDGGRVVAGGWWNRVGRWFKEAFVPSHG